MQFLSDDDFREVVEFSGPVCVSLYIPADPLNANPKANSIAFKNVVNDTLTELNSHKIKDKTAQTLDALCENILDDKIFWKGNQQSFAFFVSGDMVKYYKLPTSHPDFVMITDHFYITPMIPLIDQQLQFFVLELDKEHTRMWRGNIATLEKVEIPDLPESIAEVTGREMNERQLQFHTGTASPGGGKRPAMFHGSSSWQDDKERYAERFLQAVDKAVSAFFQDKKYPLLLSGVEELTVLFRKISQYSHLFETNLPKVDNPPQREKILHEHALSLLSSLIEEQKATALANFEEEPQQTKRVTILPEVLRQAAQGKVDTLFIAENKRVWGTFEPETLTAVIENEQQPFSAELINVAARLTLQNSGTVISFPDEQVPGGTIAALLRY
jgi:hypothetical protein